MADTLDRAIQQINLPDLLNELCPTPETARLSRERGGLIRDPRPGREERHPSFSVNRKAGCWLYHRFGTNDGGNAFTLLVDLGWSRREATRELIRRAGLSESNQGQRSRSSRKPKPNLLEQCRTASATHHPLEMPELERLQRLCEPIPADDPIHDVLAKRGLCNLPVEVLPMQRLRKDFGPRDQPLARAGALVLLIIGPDGRPWAAKVRNLDPLERDGQTVPRYCYLIGGHGTPAWCSPNYGTGSSVLICEGELNAVAAHMALRHSGLRIDLQGIAGSNAWPHIVGLEGRNVMIYADADSAGQGAVTRWTELARASQAKSVRVIEAFDGLDFCNLAAKYGLEVFGAWLELALA
jgi:hypothetical protein